MSEVYNEDSEVLKAVNVECIFLDYSYTMLVSWCGFIISDTWASLDSDSAQSILHLQ